MEKTLEFPDNHKQCQPDILLSKAQTTLRKEIANKTSQTDSPYFTNSEVQTENIENLDRKSPNQNSDRRNSL